MKKRRLAYIVYDSDTTTKRRVKSAEQKLAAALNTRGCDVRVVGLPPADGSGKQGADDFLKARGKSAFAKLTRAAQSVGNTTTQAGKTTLLCVADVEQRTVEWLWEGRLPLGMLSGLEGNPNEGKSFVALEIAAQGSRGRQPFTNARCEPFNTLYLTNENPTAFVLKPRFAAMGGDDRKLFVLEGPITLSEPDCIEDAVRKTNARLVVLDPLQSYMGADVDSHKATETRPLLDGLASIADKNHICILLIRHLAKGNGVRAIHRGLGSVDITGAMRSVLMVGTPDGEPQNRALVHIKNNVGPMAESIGFGIEGKGNKAKVVWRGRSNLTSADLMAVGQVPKRKTQVDTASEWLRAALGEGPRMAVELFAEWTEESGMLPENAKKVLQRASSIVAGVRKQRRGKGGPWLWELRQPKFAGKPRVGGSCP